MRRWRDRGERGVRQNWASICGTAREEEKGLEENGMERSDEEEGRACDVYPLVRATWS